MKIVAPVLLAISGAGHRAELVALHAITLNDFLAIPFRQRVLTPNGKSAVEKNDHHHQTQFFRHGSSVKKLRCRYIEKRRIKKSFLDPINPAKPHNSDARWMMKWSTGLQSSSVGRGYGNETTWPLAPPVAATRPDNASTTSRLRLFHGRAFRRWLGSARTGRA